MTLLLILLAGTLAYLVAVLRMATIAEIGYGATISLAGTVIEQSVDFTAPELEIPEVKITNNQSAAATQEYLPGLCEPGSVTVNFIYNSGDFNTVFNLWAGRLIFPMLYTAPDGSVFSNPSCFVKSLKKAGPMEGAETFDLVIKLSGPPSFN